MQAASGGWGWGVHFKCESSSHNLDTTKSDFDQTRRDALGPVWSSSMSSHCTSLFSFICWKSIPNSNISYPLIQCIHRALCSPQQIPMFFLPCHKYCMWCHTHLYSHSNLTAVGYCSDPQYHSLHTTSCANATVNWLAKRVTMQATRKKSEGKKKKQMHRMWSGYS